MRDFVVIAKLWGTALGYWTLIIGSFVFFVAVFKFVWGVL